MPNLAEMSIDDLVDRGKELRSELADIPEGERAEKMPPLAKEAEELDVQMGLSLLAVRRDNAVLASTAGGGAGNSDDEKMALRSLGEMIASDELIKWAAGSGSKEAEWSLSELAGLDDNVRFSLDTLMTRAMSDWGSSGPPGFDPSGAGNLLPVGQPIAPVPRQARLFLRDLFPKMTTTLAAIPYVQELSPTVGEGASAVAEGGVKPGANPLFVGAKADPTVIAATLILSKQLFEDSQAVVQYINQRLPYMVRFAEDAEFLNGNGTWPNIQGILGTAGVQTQTNGASDNAQTFGSAFAKIENSDGTPTAVVLNPTNAWSMFVKRAAAGAGTFDAGTPFSALPLTIWGVPSYRTRAMPVNTGLVADFQLGGMIVDREQVNVQTYRERYAEMNQILLVCEERVGLMLFRPDLFCNVTGLG